MEHKSSTKIGSDRKLVKETIEIVRVLRATIPAYLHELAQNLNLEDPLASISRCDQVQSDRACHLFHTNVFYPIINHM